MSGFAAIVHLDGALVDRAWLERMADFLAFRGPDGREIWISGSAGLCHTLFRTSAETDGRAQIATLDNRFWIAGQIRIDERKNLLPKLPLAAPRASSAELVLHAYAAWGESCVEHLLGDFSFVIWDQPRQRVFAARDHLGIRPLFYSQIRNCLLISNTLECVRQAPIVTDELNGYAIGDLLMVGQNRHPDQTYFAAIRRLPVAHSLMAGRDGVRTKRYWNLPVDEPLHYKSGSEYVDRFHELLEEAVHDRLPDGRVGVFMSGGLDSPALAATAVRLQAPVAAFTNVWDRLIPDEERHYAGLVAGHLQIPIFYNVQEDRYWGWKHDSEPIHTPEPVDNPLGLAAHNEFLREISRHARVFFWGDGPDAALFYEWRRYLSYLIRHCQWGRVCYDLAMHAKAFRRIPLLSTLPRMWREKRVKENGRRADFPKWIDAAFEQRFGLKERWQELHAEKPSPHPIRKDAYASFACDFPMEWNTGNGGCPGEPPLDYSHPFWDIRILRFLLAIPVVPWCREKYLMRTAMRGVLPETVRQRPKTPVPGVPYLLRAQQTLKPNLPASAELANYVDTAHVAEWPGRCWEDLCDAFKVISLQYWLLAR